MATSRTGTATYLRNRKRVLTQALADGMTHCPGYEDAQGTWHPCGRELNYDEPRLPESAETDHILSSRFGGTDAVENLRVLCRECNERKGDGSRVRTGFADAQDFPMSRIW